MAQKYYNSTEAAAKLGITAAQVNEMVLKRELYGYRDGADWKFKIEDIDRIVSERASGGDTIGMDDDNVLASEVELGHSDPGLSGTVIGADKSAKPADSDINLGHSDVKLADETNLSDLNLLESGIDLTAPQAPAAAKKPAAQASQFDDLDMTLDHDMTLEDSIVSPTPRKPAAQAGRPHSGSTGDSGVAVGDKEEKLEDDDLVLGGSGTGSDISIGGDSGISLVDPADSGLSLEGPMNLSKDDESLELGEDDLLGAPSDIGAISGLKGDEDFQLTPMEDISDGDESESGSQVIALDTESEGDEAATMVASGLQPAAMLDEDFGSEATLAQMPVMSATSGIGLDGSEEALTLAGGGHAAALPEAPYSVWNLLSLLVVCILLILVGMMMYELLRNMWGFDQPVQTNTFDAWFMDNILNLFEK